jgi:hypothetical protein
MKKPLSFLLAVAGWMLLLTFHLFPQGLVPIGRIGDISLIIIPTPEAPSSSVDISFEEYSSLRAEIAEIPYTKSDLASNKMLSPANFRKGFSIFFKNVDGAYDFSSWPTESSVRIFYIINCTDTVMKLVESDIESALKQELIIEINLALYSVRSSLRRGRLDVENKKFSSLKAGDFITLFFLVEGEKRYTAISHLQGFNFHWAVPSILKTNVSKLCAGESTTFFEATPIATLALGGIYNTSTKNGIGLVGIASADVLWMLSRVGEQIQGADFRNLLESFLFGGAVLWKCKGNFLYMGAGASWIFNQDTHTFSPQFNIIAGARIFELLSNILSPLER